MSKIEQPRLRKIYFDEIRLKLQKELGFKNIMQVPRLQKIVLNMGIGEAALDRKHVEPVLNELSLITGQKALPCRSRRAIAGFKLREGSIIGAKVTIRSGRMYEFLDRLINIAMPRIRDFRGVKTKSFDGRGNFSFGLKEQIVFPEINYDKVDKIRGMDITICTSAGNNKDAQALLAAFRIPFQTWFTENNMAKQSLIQREIRRKRLANKFADRRKTLKLVIMNRSLSIEQRFSAQLKLSELPRNGAVIRQRNRCVITGRPRGIYRKFQLSRIAFRELASSGMLPGVTKSSW